MRFWRRFTRWKATESNNRAALWLPFVDNRISDTMTHRDARNSPLQGAERRVDAVTADVVEVGLLYVDVFGRSNAEAYFAATDVAPAVYRRVVRGTFRRPDRGHDSGAELVPT